VVGRYDEARREALTRALTEDVSAALAPYRDDTGQPFPQQAHVLLARA
jgi:hypothetical protein